MDQQVEGHGNGHKQDQAGIARMGLIAFTAVAALLQVACSGDNTGNAVDAQLAPDMLDYGVQADAAARKRTHPRDDRDGVPPSTPASIKAAPNSTSGINVGWNAASDNVAVAGYMVLRCKGSGCTPSTQIAMPTSTSYADSGLDPASQYAYRVAAVDAAGNVSAPSDVAAASTLAPQPPAADTAAPTAPSSVVASANSASSITVSWSASSDNVAVTGYRLYRCGGVGCVPSAQIGAPTTQSHVDSGLVAASSYTYKVAAVDGAGNVSALSASASATTPSAPSTSTSGQDFAARCSTAGVLKCEGFDTAGAVAPATWPSAGNYPVRVGQSTQSPVFDADIKSAGGGSLKFIIPGFSPANAGGQWRQDFGQSFGTGTTFYVQFRQRFSSEMLSVNWASFGGAFKQSIFHNGAATCSDVELTTANYYDSDLPIIYTECGGRSLWTNNGVPPTLLQQGDYNCAYGSINGTNCFIYPANEWLTFYYKVSIGNWGQANSSIEAWVAREGQAFKKWVSITGFVLNNSTPGKDYDYLTLLPYMTGKNATVDHPTAYTWYDELIVSTRPIAPPAGVSSGNAPSPSTTPTADTVPPSTPVVSSAVASSSTSIALSWNAASDNVGVAGYRLYRCEGSGCTPSVQVASPATNSHVDTGLAASRTYTYRVAAVDGAGNVSAASALLSATTQAGGSGAGSGGALPATVGWYQIPNSTIDSVCAAAHGFPQVWGNSGCAGILAWSGGAFDTRRNRLIVWGGGHTDYYGNELYALSLNDLTMRRLTDPSLPIATSCTESIAGGNQPNSRHTYDGVEYMENVDRLFVFSGALACGAGTGGQDTWTFDFATMQWQRMYPSGPAPRGEMGMLTAYDPNSGRVFVHDRVNLYAYDFATNSYTRVSTQSVALGYHLAATIDPKRKLFIVAGYDAAAGAGRVYTYDISGATNGQMTVLPTTGATGIVGSTYPGLDYDPVSDRIVAWAGGDTVYSLNVDTRTWTATTFAGSPGAVNNTGTHGRWRYSPAERAFVTVNKNNQNAFVLRMQ